MDRLRMHKPPNCSQVLRSHLNGFLGAYANTQTAPQVLCIHWDTWTPKANAHARTLNNAPQTPRICSSITGKTLEIKLFLLNITSNGCRRPQNCSQIPRTRWMIYEVTGSDNAVPPEVNKNTPCWEQNYVFGLIRSRDYTLGTNGTCATSWWRHALNFACVLI